MSVFHLESSQVVGNFVHSLDDESFKSVLVGYLKLIGSGYGPYGSTTLITNAAGSTTLTASSGELLKQLSLFHPTLKYLSAIITAQNNTYGLYGLFTGLLTGSWLLSALRCQVDIQSHAMFSEVAERILSQVLATLQAQPSFVTWQSDVGDMQQMLAIVRSILTSKASLRLNALELQSVSVQLLKAFLMTIPLEGLTQNFGTVNIVTHDGPSNGDPLVYKGILYPSPDIPTWRGIHQSNIHMSELCVILFVTPLNFEPDRNVIIENIIGVSNESSFVESILPILLDVIMCRNIQVVANQKVIHPLLKFELERQGVLVLERLGTVLTEHLVNLTGCLPVGGLSKCEMERAVLGSLSGVENVFCWEKNYLLLAKENCSIVTLLLPGMNCQEQETLVELAESCLVALKVVIQDNIVVSGGGCLETWMASEIIHLVNKSFALSLNTTVIIVSKVANALVKALLDMAVQLAGGSNSSKFNWCVDSLQYHLWSCHPRQETSKVIGQCDQIEIVSKSCICGRISQEFVQENLGCWQSVFRMMSHEINLSTDSNKMHKLVNNAVSVDILSSFKNFHSDDSCNNLCSNLQCNLPVANSNDLIIDCFPAKMNALRLAVEAFVQLLSIKYCIFDK